MLVANNNYLSPEPPLIQTWISSLTSLNYEIAIKIRFTLILTMIDDSYQHDFKKPNLNLSWDSVEYISSTNTLSTCFDQLLCLRSDIWITLALAHELGHAISFQQKLFTSAREEEKVADTIAGFILKNLQREWYLGTSDLQNAFKEFLYLWDLEEYVSSTHWEINTHWTGEERKWSIEKWYLMDNDWIHKFLQSFTLEEISKNIMDGTYQVNSNTL